ncbi:hypothetical protein Tco_0600224 [Tanacetum coccineum]|uniref:Uncharacterized protein n=1 Tax=Tanacetum coccineum TaxID=301880 RepID=A0ABQ4WB48_9ASTR
MGPPEPSSSGRNRSKRSAQQNQIGAEPHDASNSQNVRRRLLTDYVNIAGAKAKTVEQCLSTKDGQTRVINSPCFLVKSWLVQDQTVLGKDYSNLLIADSLLKTIWFINAPCYGNEALASPNTDDEELSIPEQTATGKGTSNPLMAGSLPKTIKPT